MSNKSELEKISRRRNFAIFLKQMHGMLEPASAMNKRHVEFASEIMGILDNYESIVVREESKNIENGIPK